MDSNKCSRRVAKRGLQTFRGKVVASCWDISKGFMGEVVFELNLG